MVLEYNIESALKTAMKSATDLLSTKPAYRCFLVDDASTSDYEEVLYPYVSIIAMPIIPNSYQSLYKVCPVRVRIATHLDFDKKRQALSAIYGAVRGVIESDSFSITGMSKKSTMIEEGDSGVDDTESFIEITLNIHFCSS